MAGTCTDEDERFFQTAKRLLKPGGFLVWGNAIPTSTWQPCFDYLESIGMKIVEVRDVTKEAVLARDEDKARVDAYVDQCNDALVRLPHPGARREEARRGRARAEELLAPPRHASLREHGRRDGHLQGRPLPEAVLIHGGTTPRRSA